MLVHKIKKDWGKYVIKTCKGKSDCFVCATAGVPSVALDCDALKVDAAFNSIKARHGKSSDCLLIEHDNVMQVAVIEFKSNWSDGAGAARQLLAGCQIAKTLLSEYKPKKEYKIYLIVSANRHPEMVRKKFCHEIKTSGESIERVITAGCHEQFESLRNRKRDA